MYKFYRGYIIGPEEEPYRYGIPEIGIFKDKDKVEQNLPLHWSESDVEASHWIDNYINETAIYGSAMEADVEELNTRGEAGVIANLYAMIGDSGVTLGNIYDLMKLGVKKIEDDFSKGTVSWIGHVPTAAEMTKVINALGEKFSW